MLGLELPIKYTLKLQPFFSTDEEPMDVHDDFCSVCEELGDLLCCDICSRAFHIGCVYPPIRKVPRGDWSCQVCTGADSDLPKARRVQTIERERGNDLRKLVIYSAGAVFKVLWRSGVILCLTLHPEQSSGVGSMPGRASPLECHDKGIADSISA